MQLIKNHEKEADLLFFIGILIELLVMVVDQSSAYTLPFRGRAVQLAFVLFCLKISMTYYNRKQWTIMVICGIIGVISFFTCGDEYVVRVIAMVFAAKNIRINKVYFVVLGGMLLSGIIIGCLAILGLAGDIYHVADYGRGSVETRYCLGFNHANNLHMYFWYICVIALLIANKSKIVFLSALFTVLNVLVYRLTFSKTGFFALEFLVVSIIVVEYAPKIINSLVCMVCVLVELSSFLLLTIHASVNNIGTSKLMAFLDPLLTGRLEAVGEYGRMKFWRLFPGPRYTSIIDNGFAKLVYIYGIVVALMYIVVTVYMIVRFFEDNDCKALVILASTLMVVFMEATYVFNVSLLCNIFYILIFNRWYRSTTE